MFTEESSPQSTSLNDQPLPSPDPNAGLEPTPAITTLTAPPAPWWLPWVDVLKAGLVWLGSVGVLIVIPILMSLPYAIYKLAQGVSQQALVTDPKLILFSVVAIIPVHVITFAIGWWYITKGGKQPFWKTIGFEWPENMSSTVGVMVSVLLALVLYALAALITNILGGGKTDLDILIESSFAARLLLAFAAVATAPLVEELIYRGVLYRPLENATGKVVSVFVISLLFSGIHVPQYWNNPAVILVITLLSFTLTATRAFTGKLLPAFIIHLVFNGIQSVLIVLQAFVKSDWLK